MQGQITQKLIDPGRHVKSFEAGATLQYESRVRDADGEVYCLGVADEKGFGPKDWAEGKYGATAIEFKQLRHGLAEE